MLQNFLDTLSKWRSGSLVGDWVTFPDPPPPPSQVIQAEKNKRQDLAIMATSYAGLLRARKHTYIPEKDFHTVDKSKASDPPGRGWRRRTDFSDIGVHTRLGMGFRGI